MNNRKPLALKYRPQKFSQLIGQESMVISIQNAIKLNRIPNAYLLTGIRGTGKTTTVRIIAKAINCEIGFALDKMPCLYKHTTRATGWVVDNAVIRLNKVHNHLNQ